GGAGGALGGGAVQQLEGVLAGGLAVLVVADHAAEEVRREDFRRVKVPPRERGLAAAGGTDQGDETQFRERDLHTPPKRTNRQGPRDAEKTVDTKQYQV